MLDPDSFPLVEHNWIQRKPKKIRHLPSFQIYITDTMSLKRAWDSLLERSPNQLGQKIDALLIKYHNKQITSDDIQNVVHSIADGDAILEKLPDK